MSLYSVKQGGAQATIPWAQALTLFPGGGNLGNFYSLYNSLGTVTLTGANTIATLLDGPEKVVVYDSLTLGDGTTTTSLTASNRCKGLCIVVKGALTIKANATLHMTGKGARVLTNDDPFFPFVDFKIPTQIALSSSLVTYKQALAVIAAQGFAPWDQGTWQALVSQLFGFNLSVTQAGALALLSATGCGAARSGCLGGAGYTGNTGVNGGTGSGGVGAANSSSWSATAYSGAGNPYSGGSGSGGNGGGGWNGTTPCGQAPFYSGQGGPGGGSWSNANTGLQGSGYGGGGAGNPGGLQGVLDSGSQGSSGTGGKLVIIAGSVTIQSGGTMAANGMPGGSSVNGSGGGGGSGGGHISIITPLSANYSNGGTVQAAGGAGGASGSYPGGAGGAGSVVVKQYSDLGW